MIYTIGYEGRTLEEFVSILQENNIQLLIDIREYPGSRKKGFSKNALRSFIEGSGIDYTHLRDLGDPKPGRLAARAGAHEEFKRIFNEHMSTAPARKALDTAANMSLSKISCLMCYEKHYQSCHRSIVANLICSINKSDFKHLGSAEDPALVRRNAQREMSHTH